jgi:hypothetical protein
MDPSVTPRQQREFPEPAMLWITVVSNLLSYKFCLFSWQSESSRNDQTGGALDSSEQVAQRFAGSSKMIAQLLLGVDAFPS